MTQEMHFSMRLGRYVPWAQTIVFRFHFVKNKKWLFSRENELLES